MTVAGLFQGYVLIWEEGNDSLPKVDYAVSREVLLVVQNETLGGHSYVQHSCRRFAAILSASHRAPWTCVQGYHLPSLRDYWRGPTCAEQRYQASEKQT